MRPESICFASSASKVHHSSARVGARTGAGARCGAAGTRTVKVMVRSTIRSTTSFAERPDSAARCCSHARCLHAAPHHFGTRPRAGTPTADPHHPHVTDAGRRMMSRRRAGPSELGDSTSEAYRHNDRPLPVRDLSARGVWHVTSAARVASMWLGGSTTDLSRCVATWSVAALVAGERHDRGRAEAAGPGSPVGVLPGPVGTRDAFRGTLDGRLWAWQAPRSRGADGGDLDVLPSASSPAPVLQRPRLAASPVLQPPRLAAPWAATITGCWRRKRYCSQLLDGGGPATPDAWSSSTLQTASRHGFASVVAAEDGDRGVYGGRFRPSIRVTGNGRCEPGRCLSSRG